jgi:hypothetical protein
MISKVSEQLRVRILLGAQGLADDEMSRPKCKKATRINEAA